MTIQPGTYDPSVSGTTVTANQGSAGVSAWPVSNTNLDVLLSSRLKAADTLAGVTTVGTITTITNPVTIAGTITATIADNLARQIGTFPFATRQDTYTGTGNGTTITIATYPMRDYSIQVKGTGASATTWDVRVEGSLDNVNFTTLLSHTNTTGDGVILFSGSNDYPSLYFRSRCVGLVLGGATNIVVTILGIQ